MCTLFCNERENLPDPTARMAAWGGFTTAQNCLIPKGPPKLDTVNVPPWEWRLYYKRLFPKDRYAQWVSRFCSPHNLPALRCSLLLFEPTTELLLQLWTDLSCLRPGISHWYSSVIRNLCKTNSLLNAVLHTHLHHRNIQPIFCLHCDVDVYVFKPTYRMVKMFAKPEIFKSLQSMYLLADVIISPWTIALRNFSES